MAQWFEWPVRRPKAVLAGIGLLTVLALTSLWKPGLTLDTDPYLLPSDHPDMVAFDKVKQDFSGNLETALVMLHTGQPGGVFSPATLARVQDISTGLEQLSLMDGSETARLRGFLPQLPEGPRATLAGLLERGLTLDTTGDLQFLLFELGDALPPGFQAAVDETILRLQPVKEVTSLSTVENLVSKEGTLHAGKLFDAVPTQPAQVQALAAEVRANTLYENALVNPEGTSTAIFVETYVPHTRTDLFIAMERKIHQLLQDLPGPEETYLAGMPILTGTFTRIIQRDNANFFPMVFALVVVVLWLTFRMASGVILPMTVVLLSVIWTLAAMALLRVPINTITTSLPVFLITVGVADGIHMLSEYKTRLAALGNRAAAAAATMRQLAIPVLMTSFTTAAGFASLAYTEITHIRFFGLFVALGVLFAMVISLLFLPAALSLGRVKPPQAARAPGAFRRGVAALETRAMEGLVAVARMAAHKPTWVLLGTALVVAVGVVGMQRVRVENNFVENFNPTLDIVRSTRALETQMAGATQMNLLIHASGTVAEPFKDPANLAQVARLQDYLATLPDVGKTSSLADMVARINLVLHDNDPAYDRLPRATEQVTGSDGSVAPVDGRLLTAQYLLLYENGGGENLSDYVDPEYRTLNVNVMLRKGSSLETEKVMAAVEQWAANNLPSGLTLKVSGNAQLISATNREVVTGQIASFSLSLGVVFLMLVVMFRSLTRGVLGVLPLLVTVVLNFGMMGYTGITLNIATAIITSVVIGIGVDFGIHYLARLDTELLRGLDLHAALAETMRHSGKAITSNAVTVSIGFLALTLSDLLPLRQVGLMIMQTLLVSAVSTLFLLPACVSLLRRRYVARATKPTLAAQAA